MPSLTLRSHTARTLAIVCVLCLTAVSVRAAENDELESRAKAMIQEAQQIAEKGRIEKAKFLFHKAQLLAEEGYVNEAEEMERGAKKLLESVIQSERKHAEESDAGKTEQKRRAMEQDAARKATESTKSTKRELDLREHKAVHPEHHDLEKAAQRIQHVRIAAENLRAAGMTDLANAAAQRAEEMERQLREAHAHREQAARAGGHDHRDEAIEELRREVRQLREELKAIHARLEK